jgi:hypothetical protein
MFTFSSPLNSSASPFYPAGSWLCCFYRTQNNIDLLSQLIIEGIVQYIFLVRGSKEDNAQNQKNEQIGNAQTLNLHTASVSTPLPHNNIGLQSYPLLINHPRSTHITRPTTHRHILIK